MGLFDKLGDFLKNSKGVIDDPSQRWGQRSYYSDGSLGKKGRKQPPKAVMQTMRLPATGPRPEARPYQPLPQGANAPIPTPRPPDQQVLPELRLDRFDAPQPQQGPMPLAPMQGPQLSAPVGPVQRGNALAEPMGLYPPPPQQAGPQQPVDAVQMNWGGGGGGPRTTPTGPRPRPQQGPQPFDAQGRFGAGPGEMPPMSPLDWIKLMYGGGEGM